MSDEHLERLREAVASGKGRGAEAHIEFAEALIRADWRDATPPARR
jgi:hypothetical protein